MRKYSTLERIDNCLIIVVLCFRQFSTIQQWICQNSQSLRAVRQRDTPQTDLFRLESLNIYNYMAQQVETVVENYMWLNCVCACCMCEERLWEMYTIEMLNKRWTKESSSLITLECKHNIQTKWIITFQFNCSTLFLCTHSRKSSNHICLQSII